MTTKTAIQCWMERITAHWLLIPVKMITMVQLKWKTYLPKTEFSIRTKNLCRFKETLLIERSLLLLERYWLGQ